MGEDVPLCLSLTVPCIRAATTVPLLGVEASMVEGIAGHPQDLAGAAPPLPSSVRLGGATRHLPRLPVYTVLREHCASCSTSWPAVSSHQPSRQHDRGRAEEKGVTAGRWAWLRLLRGECSTTHRKRSLCGLSNSVCYNRQRTLTHCGIRPWYTAATTGVENFA